MLQIINRQILRTFPFEQYHDLPGWSHSLIKAEGKESKPATQRMMLGTAVHQYLLEPHLYQHDNIDIVRPAAIAIKNKVGALWQYMEPELTVTCDMVCNGFSMPYKGRMDLGIVDRLCIDIKVSPVPLAVSKLLYGYDDQQNGYIAGFGAKVGLIIRINPKTCGIPGREPEIETYVVPISTQFWEYQIVSRGKPI